MKFSQALIFTACVPISLVSASMMGLSSYSSQRMAKQLAKREEKCGDADVPRDIAGDELSCKMVVTLSTSPESTGGTEAEATDDPSKCRTLTLKFSHATRKVLATVGSGLVKGTVLPGVLMVYLCYSGYVMCETIEERCHPEPEAETDRDAVDEATIEPADENKILLWLSCIDKCVWDSVKWTCKRGLQGMMNCLVGSFGCKDNKLIGCFPTLWNEFMAAKRAGLKESFKKSVGFKKGDTWCWPFQDNCKKTGRSLACFTQQICKGINYFCYCCRAAKRKKNAEDDEGSDGSVIDGEDAVEIVEGVMACVVSCSK